MKLINKQFSVLLLGAFVTFFACNAPKEKEEQEIVKVEVSKKNLKKEKQQLIDKLQKTGKNIEQKLHKCLILY